MDILALSEAQHFLSLVGPWWERLLVLEALAGLILLFYPFKDKKGLTSLGWSFLVVTSLTLGLGFVSLCYLHLAIHHSVVLSLPAKTGEMLNHWLSQWSSQASVHLPPYDPYHPPRFAPPPWLGDEKYLFWFLGYAILCLWAWKRAPWGLTRRLLLALVSIQLALLGLVFHPLSHPLPGFFEEISLWWAPLSPAQRVGLFLKLYPRLLFYYNAPYMWVHPPLLLLAYAALEIFFVACVSMFWIKDLQVERLAYVFARPGYFSLTLGMLLGFPWALEAWGGNWWWDPKIASSLMMWVVFSTYLHARLYLSRKGMWNFTAFLGILSFSAMLFTVVASYLFGGQHTVH